MRTSRYFVRLIWAFIVRFKLLFLAGFVVGLVFFVGLTVLIPRLNSSVEKIGIIGEYASDQIPDSILLYVSSGLNVIAKNWEPSDSGKVWTYHLKDNLKWQDGTSLTSADINYNFSGIKVEKPDKYTLVFKLDSAFSPFPSTVEKPVFKKGFLGIGEWKVTGLTLANSFVESLTMIDAKKNTKVFKFYPTQERAKLAYELGEVDEVQNLTDTKPFDGWKTVEIKKAVNEQRYAAVFFNTKDDIVGDKDIRQALSYAIDKQALGGDRALGPIAATSWAYNPQVKPYDFNLERARVLIDQAKINPDDKKNLKIKLTTLPDLLPVAEAIAKNWKAVGVSVTVQVTYFVPDEYQAFLAIYDSPIDPDQYLTWHSSQTRANISRYDNKRIDKLLEDGRLEVDLEKRKKIYLDFQRFLIEDAPAAFLYHPVYYTISRLGR